MCIKKCSKKNMFGGIINRRFWKIYMPSTAYTLCSCLFATRFCTITTLIFTFYRAFTKSSIRFVFNVTIYSIKFLLFWPTSITLKASYQVVNIFPWYKTGSESFTRFSVCCINGWKKFAMLLGVVLLKVSLWVRKEEVEELFIVK